MISIFEKIFVLSQIKKVVHKIKKNKLKILLMLIFIMATVTKDGIYMNSGSALNLRPILFKGCFI